jgi:hypothetical protein
MRHFFVRIIGALEFNYSNLPAANLKKAAAVDGIEKNLKKSRAYYIAVAPGIKVTKQQK